LVSAPQDTFYKIISTAYSNSNPYDSPSVSEGITTFAQVQPELKGNWNLTSFQLLSTYSKAMLASTKTCNLLIPEPRMIAQIMDLYFIKASYIISVLQATKS
jgi:hypothetical protein